MANAKRRHSIHQPVYIPYPASGIEKKVVQNPGHNKL